MRSALMGDLAGLVFVLAIASPALAQAPPDPGGAPPVVATDRPARWVLTGGTVIVGTKVGEDEEFFSVQTDGGIVRIRKSSIASIDFGAPSTPPPPPQPTPRVEDEPAGRGSAGAGLLVSGLITFGSIYAMTFIGGIVVSFFDDDAVWMYVPVLGPVLYYTKGDVSEAALAPFIMISAIQGIGVLIAIAGGIVMLASSGSDTAEGGERFADGLRLTPAISPEAQGAVLSFDF